MTVHVLHAGDGYTYLTRQVASGDHQRGRGESLADYYTATGNPPGRWAGSGLDELGIDGTVTEAQMRALFGKGLHPDADRIRTERTALYLAAGETPARAAAAAERDVQLGRRFPQFTPKVDGWRDRQTAAYAAEAGRLGLAEAKDLTGADRDRVRTRLGTETFLEVHGRDPRSESELRSWIARQARPVRQPVAGYDLVFTPVKSVSVLWALAAPEVSRQVAAAHHAAVARALAFIEQHAALTRAGAGGIAQLDTHGLTVALFDHRDSRSGDPNLHTHAAVSTKIRGRDGKWRSLDGRALFAIAVAASETYNTAVEDELRSRLGVAFASRTPVHGPVVPGAGELREDGLRSVREIVGIDRRLLDRFASRRAAVETEYRSRLAAYRQRWGHEPSRSVQMKLAQEATLATRSAKHGPRSLDQLRTDWMAQARSALRVGTDQEVRSSVHAALRRHQPAGRPGPTADQLAEVADRVVKTVADHRATWTVWHLRAEAERRLRVVPVPRPADRDRLVEQVTSLALDRSIRLTVPPAETVSPTPLTRGDERSVFTVHGGDLYTSTAVLDAEDRLVAAARHPVEAPVPEVGPLEGLDAGQQALVRAFATGGRRLIAGIGPAGSGKTTAMRALVEAAAGAGVRVVGLAPSARAAQVLSDELGIPAETLHKLLHTLGTDHDQVDVRAGDILLVDEAGMAGTLRLARLVELAEERGAVARLLGDSRQLAAVESGGALRLIEGEVGAVRLDVIHRFRDPAEAEASLAIRAGRELGLVFYREAGRIHAGSADAVTDAAYEAWRADTAAGLTSVLLARSGEQVRELSARARLDRIADGVVDPTRQVRLHNGSHAGVGDIVLTRRNDRRQVTSPGRDWVKNGDLWRVLAVAADGTLDLVHTRHRGRVRLGREYVAAEVELGYAATIHRAQGMTVDITRLLVDHGLTRQALYTGLTRGRIANHLYVATHGLLGVDADRPPEPELDPIDLLVDVLARDGSERPATHVARDEQTAATSLARLVPEYLHAYALHAEATYRLKQATIAVLGPELGRAVLEDTAWPHLASALAQVAGAGRDPSAALVAAASQRELASATSPAEVLTWRIRPSHQTVTQDARLPLGVPVPPFGAQGDLLAEWLRQRADRIRERVSALTRQATVTGEPWIRALGPAPSDPAGREAWRARVAAVVSYREQYRIADRKEPIGGRPSQAGHQRDTWTQLQARLATHDHPDRRAHDTIRQGRPPRIQL